MGRPVEVRVFSPAPSFPYPQARPGFRSSLTLRAAVRLANRSGSRLIFQRPPLFHSHLASGWSGAMSALSPGGDRSRPSLSSWGVEQSVSSPAYAGGVREAGAESDHQIRTVTPPQSSDSPAGPAAIAPCITAWEDAARITQPVLY